ncbi:NADH dehydrogenase subunit 5 (mitochondrion) [Candida pseudojiufengensis]|uniref:NADH-ubiquinone oxidoreductase chain 5 n=1 Tax=Candida pseudojiufengensis TaxID=497109 RepID=S5TFC6_9ASCO|nr:NADH dehydrogenase subunit 5 [Candida pseudojiufengensis]AGS44152.1 NADH dehydrogenase subunit 5 [Candida pseudojiufengensis]
MFQYFYYIWEEPIRIHIGDWVNIGDINISYGIILDSLSMTVMVPVGIVTMCVLLYAIEYMSHDPKRNTFLIILSVFAIFMTILVVSDNYIMMFIGWEFVGVISYLLISFWSTRIAAMKAALSAILLNRMGDTFFMLVLCILLKDFHAVDFDTLEMLAPSMEPLLIFSICLFLLLAATAKSAQLGLHAWLLHAMEGPTPVSALLHAATMVCAGVYVLVRSYFLIQYSSTILFIICWLGGITTLVSGLIAIVTNDIKRVIALSTMSQLSIMVLAIGISSYDLAIYHLYCHAFFKALLFMGAGSVIHSYISETQDMRKYGGLINYLPFSYTAILIASLSLMAIPGLTGYYSKDIIIESLYGTYTFSGYVLYYIAVGSATLTSLYSIRLLYLTFYNNPNSNKASYQYIHENIYMLIPMIILIIYSIFIGFNRDNVIAHYGMQIPANNNFIETEFTLPWYIKLLPLILGLSLSLLLVYIYEYAYKVRPSVIHNYFNNKIYFDQLLNNIVIRKTLVFGGYLNSKIENGLLLKIFGSVGISKALRYVNYIFILNLLYLFFFS